MYYRLSYNFILAEMTGLSEEGFPRTCVFLISASRKQTHLKIKYKGQEAYGHIVMKKACGDWVPVTWIPSDGNSYACSHLCETFWKLMLSELKWLRRLGWTLSVRCVNPQHVHVETLRMNIARRSCTGVSAQGCQCGSQPPCLWFNEEERMEQVDLAATYFKQ